jgi:hypothetical protein
MFAFGPIVKERSYRYDNFFTGFLGRPPVIGLVTAL